jgi:hypothetical protein
MTTSDATANEERNAPLLSADQSEESVLVEPSPGRENYPETRSVVWPETLAFRWQHVDRALAADQVGFSGIA